MGPFSPLDRYWGYYPIPWREGMTLEVFALNP